MWPMGLLLKCCHGSKGCSSKEYLREVRCLFFQTNHQLTKNMYIKKVMDIIYNRQTDQQNFVFRSGLAVYVVFVDRYLESLMERQCTLVSDIMRTLNVCQFLLGIIKPELGDFAKLPGFYGSFCLCLVKIETPLDIVFSKFLDPGYP